MPQRIGLVLAGGAGRRMGSTKGDLEVGGRRLAERAATALWPLCGGVVISLGTEGQNPAPGFPVVRDPEPAGRGPLAGIGAAFDTTGHADLLVLACDYPRVETALLEALVGRAEESDDLVIPTDGRGMDHPLVGLWKRSAAVPVREALEHGLFTVRALLAELAVRRLRPGDVSGLDLDEVLLNVNTPDDLTGVD